MQYPGTSTQEPVENHTNQLVDRFTDLLLDTGYWVLGTHCGESA
jgi:hypothetical protein